MGFAALISWLVTALFGLYLLAVWLIENDVTHRGAAASRLPAPVIFAHVLLALTGLVFWVIYLLSDSDTPGWAAIGILGGVATMGLTMFTRWIRCTGPTWPPTPRRTGRSSSTSQQNGLSRWPSSPVTACSPSRP